MRKEVCELLFSRAEVIYHRNGQGKLLEPFETLYVDVPNENLGDILQSLAGRKGDIVSMDHQTNSVLVEAVIPTRWLIGFESDLVNLTRGLGSMSHLFKEYGPHKGEISSRCNGALVAMENGVSTSYALNNGQEPGRPVLGSQD